MYNIYSGIIESLEKGEPIVLATIIENVGSSPRTTGTKMLVKKDSSIIGTIGGGRLEADAIDNAKKVFQNKVGFMYHFSLTGEDAANMDMICGGYGDVLLSYLTPDQPEVLTVFKKALAAGLENRKGWLITAFNRKGDCPAEICFIAENGNQSGNLEVSAEIAELAMQPQSKNALHSDHSASASLLFEPVHRRSKLLVFGGGHVSLETVRLANRVDFKTVVVDDREEFANRQRFPESDILVVPNYQQLPDFQIDEETFIVILTRGHLGDYDVLKQVIGSKAAYIGMIGSRHKREKIYQRLREEGISQQLIDQVHSPIGLQINGETPAEIAVSVVAELILERSRLK